MTETKPEATGKEYFAAFNPGETYTENAAPWAVFEVEGATVRRWISSRKAYVPVRDHHDFVTKGMSSDARDTREVTAEEAKGYQATVNPVEDWIKRYEIIR